MRDAVKSDMAHALEYDAATGTITVHFHSGGSHAFGPFTQQEYEAFRAADSIGRHFHAHIRAKAIKNG
jgi:hypothetical protein